MRTSPEDPINRTNQHLHVQHGVLLSADSVDIEFSLEVLYVHDDPYLGRKRTTFSDALCSP